MLVAAINGHSAAYPAGQVAAYVVVALIVIAVVVRRTTATHRAPPDDRMQLCPAAGFPSSS